MIVKVKRQKNKNSEAYWQEFLYPIKSSNNLVSVSSILELLKMQDTLTDVTGEKCSYVK